MEIETSHWPETVLRMQREPEQGHRIEVQEEGTEAGLPLFREGQEVHRLPFV